MDVLSGHRALPAKFAVCTLLYPIEGSQSTTIIIPWYPSLASLYMRPNHVRYREPELAEGDLSLAIHYHLAAYLPTHDR